MASNYRKKLFSTYARTHASFLEGDESEKTIWSQKYIERNYLPHLVPYDKQRIHLLEIGCSKGYFLKGFHALRFAHLKGVDLSPDDVDAAQRIAPGIEVTCQEAYEYLTSRHNQFDVIVMKAVLEHVPKDAVLPLLGEINSGLKSGGLVLIDVPNMDWLFASHERYMDFTHEVGFTKESLRQMMNNCFEKVAIFPTDQIVTRRKLGFVKRYLGRKLVQTMLSWADPDGASNWIWARSIVGTGRK